MTTKDTLNVILWTITLSSAFLIDGFLFHLEFAIALSFLILGVSILMVLCSIAWLLTRILDKLDKEG